MKKEERKFLSLFFLSLKYFEWRKRVIKMKKKEERKCRFELKFFGFWKMSKFDLNLVSQLNGPPLTKKETG